MNWRQLLMGLGSMAMGAKAVKSAIDEHQNKRQQDQLRDANPQGGNSQEPRMRLVQVRSIEERVHYIAGMIQKGRHHPKVHEFARKAVTQKCGDSWCVDEKDYRGEIEAVFYAVQKAVRYTADTWGTDLYMHPKDTIRLSSGDCDDASSLLGACLQAIGYPVKLRVVHLKGDPTWGHIYILAGIPPRQPTEWIALDRGVVPPKPPGWEVPAHMVKRRKDFLVPAQNI